MQVFLLLGGLRTGLFEAGDLGRYGTSYLELLISFEQWVGHQLLCE